MKPQNSTRRPAARLAHRVTLLACGLALFTVLAGNGPCEPGPEEPIPTDPDPELSVEIVTPADGTIVSSGLDALVRARALDPEMIGLPERVVFELSTDGERWTALPARSVQDAGPGTWSTGIDTSGIEAPEVLVRARPEGDPDGARGDTIVLGVNQSPELHVALRREGGTELATNAAAVLDASESYDPDGRIALYRFYVDGEIVESEQPIFVLPPELVQPEQPFAVEVVDLMGGEARGDFEFPIEWFENLDDVFLALQEVRQCGCTGMTVRFDPAKRTTLADPGSGNRIDYGTHPTEVSGAFEIDATIVGDPDLCEEWQRVAGTHTVNGTAHPKKACSAGRDLPICDKNADCDTHFCQLPNGGGTFELASALDALLCLALRGTNQSRGDGVCTSYPYGNAAAPHGNDDYRAPYPDDLGVKEHRPGQVIWYDAPGLAFPRNRIGFTVKTQAHFEAVVAGERGICRCRFTYELEWDGANQRWTTAPDITLDAAGNLLCTLDD